jgi:hypothetical protein
MTMPSKAIPAYGTLLKRSTADAGAATPAYVTLGEVKSISGPSTEVSTIDVTTHSSAADGNFREFIPSLIDGGTIEAELNWVPGDTSHVALWEDLNDRVKRDFQIITIPSAEATPEHAEITFTGYVTAFPMEFPTDDVQSATLTIKISGAVTIEVV